MASIIKRIIDHKLCSAQIPEFIKSNVHYEVIMGSNAYGVSNDNSDMDIYSFCIPPKAQIFPHLRGEIVGFGKPGYRFTSWQEHHIQDPELKREYDISCYSIVSYFDLCMDNNPNMIDSLFVPNRCILHTTNIGTLVRDNRKLFLHKGSWHRFRGYAHKQMGNLKRNPQGKRVEIVEKFGYDVKFAYHVVRLILEVEQILSEHNIELERNREILKSIRRGEWTETDLRNWFTEKEKTLETVYAESSLQAYPDVDKIKQLLLTCLEMHYGSLDKAIVNESKTTNLISEIQTVLARYGG